MQTIHLNLLMREPFDGDHYMWWGRTRGMIPQPDGGFWWDDVLILDEIPHKSLNMQNIS